MDFYELLTNEITQVDLEPNLTATHPSGRTLPSPPHVTLQYIPAAENLWHGLVF